MNDESDSRMVRLPVRDMRDEPAPQRAAQEGGLPPLLTDEQAMRVVINACDSLNITRLHELGGKTTTICEEAGLLEIARAIESEVRTATAAAGGGVPQRFNAHDIATLTEFLDRVSHWFPGGVDRHEALQAWARLKTALNPQPEAAQEQLEKCGNRDYCGRFPFCGCGGPEPLPERDTSKPAEQQGLFRKFDVRRTDGSDKPGGKHYGCEYFVLDVAHDKHAKAALAAYAAAVEETNPHLAQDMRDRYELSTPAQSEAAPAVAQVPQCRSDGRCQYAIDHGAEGLGHCPPGKCAMPAAPEAPAVAQVPDGWKLVPVEPTTAMINAGQCGCMDNDVTVCVYKDMLAAAPEAPAQAAPSAGEGERVLSYLDDLKDDAAVHIWPDDLEKCQTSECVVEVYSVRMGSPDGKTVPLFSRDQVAEAVRAALSHKDPQR